MDISQVYKEVEYELSLLNQKLSGVASSKYELVEEIVSHIMGSGKRVRPIVVILIAKAFGIKNLESVINASFAVEMIHTASLLHDDVVDSTKKRRGKKTANTIWGNKEAILVGDHLFTQAFLAMASLQNQQAIDIISNASYNLTVGEITQLENERNIDLTKKNYLEIIYNKTASLFEAAAALGALFSQNGEINACSEFGRNIGYAFQIMDDILDYTGSKMLNKDTGTDFNERKVTLPIILLMEVAEVAEQKAILEHFSGRGEATFSGIKNMMERHHIEQFCISEIKKYSDAALHFVDTSINNRAIKDTIINLLHFFTQRKA